MSEEVKAKNPSIWGMIWSPTEAIRKIKERPENLGSSCDCHFVVCDWYVSNLIG